MGRYDALASAIAKITKKKTPTGKPIKNVDPPDVPKVIRDPFDIGPNPKMSAFVATLASGITIGSFFTSRLDNKDRTNTFVQELPGGIEITTLPPDEHGITHQFYEPPICEINNRCYTEYEDDGSLYAIVSYYPNGDIKSRKYNQDGSWEVSWMDPVFEIKPPGTLYYDSALTNLEKDLTIKLIQSEVRRQMAIYRGGNGGDGGDGGGVVIPRNPFDPYSGGDTGTGGGYDPYNPTGGDTGDGGVGGGSNTGDLPIGQDPQTGWIPYKGTIADLPPNTNPPPTNPDYIPGKADKTLNEKIPIVQGYEIKSVQFPNMPSFETLQKVFALLMTAATALGVGIAIDEDDPDNPTTGGGGGGGEADQCLYINPSNPMINTQRIETQSGAPAGAQMDGIRMASSAAMVGPGMVSAAKADPNKSLQKKLGKPWAGFEDFRTAAGECRYWSAAEKKLIKAARRKRAKLEAKYLEKMGCTPKKRSCRLVTSSTRRPRSSCGCH